jgi:hypothetical protein
VLRETIHALPHAFVMMRLRSRLLPWPVGEGNRAQEDVLEDQVCAGAIMGMLGSRMVRFLAGMVAFFA